MGYFNGYVMDSVDLTNHVGDTTRVTVSGGHYSDARFIPASVSLHAGALSSHSFARAEDLIALGRLLIAAGEQTRATLVNATSWVDQ